MSDGHAGNRKLGLPRLRSVAATRAAVGEDVRTWRQRQPRSIFRGSRQVLFEAAQELVQSEGDFVGMGCAPDDDAFELGGILGYGADLHQLGFDDCKVSHGNPTMA